MQVNSDSEPLIATQEESQIIEWDEMGRAAMAQEEAVAHRAVDAKDGEEFAKALRGHCRCGSESKIAVRQD